MRFALYPCTNLQISRNNAFRAERSSCGVDHWIKFKTMPPNINLDYDILNFLIDGATAEEIDAIVAAINAPIMRIKGNGGERLEAAE